VGVWADGWTGGWVVVGDPARDGTREKGKETYDPCGYSH
jgi:hypothetical protein